jgi:hypothetical protein
MERPTSTDLGAAYRAPLAWAANSATSDAVELQGLVLSAVLIPAEMQGQRLTFLESHDDGATWLRAELQGLPVLSVFAAGTVANLERLVGLGADLVKVMTVNDALAEVPQTVARAAGVLLVRPELRR